MKNIYKKIVFKQLYLLFFSTNGWYLFIIYSIFAFFITYITNNIILNDTVYYNFFSEQFSIERINEIITIKNKWLWISYIFSPITYTLKFFVISICILTGLMLSDIKVAFNKIFKIILVSELIFILAITVRTIHFLLNSDFTIDEYQIYYPLALVNFFDPTKLAEWMRYPLQLVNLFELMYIFLVSSGLAILLRLNYKKSVSIVSISYLTGLFIWVVFITFLSVNF